tara:strand:+ start:198 stop:488 length:291 start_codon:yes stop_codon:yes gene_type:complete
MNKRQLRRSLRRAINEMTYNAAGGLTGEDMADQEAQLDAERNVNRLDHPDQVSDLLADLLDGLPPADFDGLYGAFQNMSEAELGAALASAILMVAG